MPQSCVAGYDALKRATRGFTKEQLYSTASYQEKNLHGIDRHSNRLARWDFNGQNLANADLNYSVLTNANNRGTWA